jgi:hypothetical protein
MSTRSGIIAVFAAALLAKGSALAADKTAIQGTVIGENGKAFGGAEIQAERVDVKAKVVLAKTDAHGHYFFVGLPPGAYSVTAYVDGVAMSRANVKTPPKGWAKVDFDLRLNAKGADGTDRMQRDLQTINGANQGR